MLNGELKSHRRSRRPSATHNMISHSAILTCKMSQHENCALLGYYAAFSDNSLLMFWDNLEDGTDRLSQNVSKELAPHAA